MGYGYFIDLMTIVAKYGIAKGYYEGVSEVQKAYSFQNRNHDDYLLVETSLKLTFYFVGVVIPEQTLDLIWAKRNGWENCQEGQLSINGNWRGTNGVGSWNYWELVPSKLVTNKPRKNLWISYVYDSDDKSRFVPHNPGRSTAGAKTFDDTGDPDPITGMFISPQYLGMATLYAEQSPSNPIDDPSIPHAVTYEGFYDGQVDYWVGSKWDFYTSNNIGPRIQDVKGLTFNSETAYPTYMIQSWGPYKMNKGNDVRSVYVLAGGMIDEDLCVSEGEKWYN